MANNDIEKVLFLLKKVNTAGIKISYSDNELSVNFAKGKVPDPELLTELRNSKNELTEYFKDSGGQPSFTNGEPGKPAGRSQPGDRDYFNITPTQLYWVDPDKDKEYKQYNPVHGNVILAYEIDGMLDLDIFRNAISCLVRRHESLRAEFPMIGGAYFMQIADPGSPVFIPEYYDIRSLPDSDQVFHRLVSFAGHRFELDKAPLFKIRLIRRVDDKFALSVKIHHVITDTISKEVFLRDLLTIYVACRKDSVPALPVLKYQYKEYLSLINANIRENYERDKKYWKSLYKDIPGEILIPDTVRKPVRMEERKLVTEKGFGFSKELTGRLNQLATRFSTTLFVVLQTTFKLFLQKETGASDILIGTYVFGRDYPGCEDQIGCYARTVLVRTVLDEKDSLQTGVEKVIKSNEDAREHKAFSLLDALQELLSSRWADRKAFWNINIQFEQSDAPDSTHPSQPGQTGVQEYMIKTLHIPEFVHPVIAIDMHLQFYYTNGVLRLDVQYDGSLYDRETIQKFFTAYIHYTDSNCPSPSAL
jgi:hypothetical protein